MRVLLLGVFVGLTLAAEVPVPQWNPVTGERMADAEASAQDFKELGLPAFNSTDHVHKHMAALLKKAKAQYPDNPSKVLQKFNKQIDEKCFQFAQILSTVTTCLVPTRYRFKLAYDSFRILLADQKSEYTKIGETWRSATNTFKTTIGTYWGATTTYEFKGRTPTLMEEMEELVKPIPEPGTAAHKAFLEEVAKKAKIGPASDSIRPAGFPENKFIPDYYGDRFSRLSDNYIRSHNELTTSYREMVESTVTYQSIATAYVATLRSYADQVERQKAASIKIFDQKDDTTDAAVIEQIRAAVLNNGKGLKVLASGVTNSWEKGGAAPSYDTQSQYNIWDNSTATVHNQKLTANEEGTFQASYLLSRDKYDVCAHQLKLRIPLFLVSKAAKVKADAVIEEGIKGDYAFRTHVYDLTERYKAAEMGTGALAYGAWECLEQARQEVDVAARAYVAMVRKMADDVEATADRWNTALTALADSWLESAGQDSLLEGKAQRSADEILAAFVQTDIKATLGRWNTVRRSAGMTVPATAWTGGVESYRKGAWAGRPFTPKGAYGNKVMYSDKKAGDELSFLTQYKENFKTIKDTHFEKYKEFLSRIAPFEQNSQAFIEMLSTFLDQIEHNYKMADTTFFEANDDSSNNVAGGEAVGAPTATAAGSAAWYINKARFKAGAKVNTGLLQKLKESKNSFLEVEAEAEQTAGEKQKYIEYTTEYMETGWAAEYGKEFTTARERFTSCNILVSKSLANFKDAWAAANTDMTKDDGRICIPHPAVSG